MAVADQCLFNADDELISVEDLLRAGLFRLAAKKLLHSYKAEPRQDISNSQLPYALVKSGHAKTALILLISLLICQPDSFNDSLLSCFEYALTRYEPALHEINQVFVLVRPIKLLPAQVASLASKIKSDPARQAVVASFASKCEWSEEQLALCNAYLDHFLGDDAKALSIAQRSFSKYPDALDYGYLCARILQKAGHTYHARRYIVALIKRDRSNMLYLIFLGQLLYSESRWRAARKIFDIVHSQSLDDISLSNKQLLQPIVPSSAGEWRFSLKGYDWLNRYLQSSPVFLGIEPSFAVCQSPLHYSFYLPYQGPVSIKKDLENVAELLRRSAQKLINVNQACAQNGLSPTNSPISGEPIKASQNPIKQCKRLRIGFVSRFFSHHSNAAAHYGLIARLDRSKFCVVVVHRPGSRVDAMHEQINSVADEVAYLSDHFGESCRQIEKLSLDILFYTDLGMYPLDRILPMVRLAPVQVTGWGLPHTSGVQEIDFYLRSSVFSDCEPETEYTEKLVSLDGYIGYFEPEEHHLEVQPRDYFLLPPDRFLVGCLQSLHKIHPDFDEYLEQIALIDPSIMIVMAPMDNDMLTHRFVRRLERNAPTAHSQLCILSKMTIADFYSLNACLDLNLDTIYYGAGVSFVQTAWNGPPYITQYSNIVRSSVVSRSYLYAGVESPPIAGSRHEYVELVRKYFNDRASLANLRNEIHLKMKDGIYRDESYIRSCEGFFMRISGR